MPIHYDTIEDGQNKKSHLFFSFLVRIVLFLHFIGGIYLLKNIITSLNWFHLNNYTPYENKCFNPRNQIHCVEFVTCVNPFAYRCVTRYAVFTRVKYATTPRNYWMRYPPRYSNGWAEFWSEPMKPLVNKLNHAHWLRISSNWSPVQVSVSSVLWCCDVPHDCPTLSISTSSTLWFIRGSW